MTANKSRTFSFGSPVRLNSSPGEARNRRFANSLVQGASDQPLRAYVTENAPVEIYMGDATTTTAFTINDPDGNILIEMGTEFDSWSTGYLTLYDRVGWPSGVAGRAAETQYPLQATWAGLKWRQITSYELASGNLLDTKFGSVIAAVGGRTYTIDGNLMTGADPGLYVPARVGQQLWIFDRDGTASPTNPITINFTNTFTGNLGSSITIERPFEAVWLIQDGSLNWMCVRWSSASGYSTTYGDDEPLYFGDDTDAHIVWASATSTLEIDSGSITLSGDLNMVDGEYIYCDTAKQVYMGYGGSSMVFQNLTDKVQWNIANPMEVLGARVFVKADLEGVQFGAGADDAHIYWSGTQLVIDGDLGGTLTADMTLIAGVTSGTITLQAAAAAMKDTTITGTAASGISPLVVNDSGGVNAFVVTLDGSGNGEANVYDTGGTRNIALLGGDNLTSWFRNGQLVIGETALAGAETFRVVGDTRLEGVVTVTDDINLADTKSLAMGDAGKTDSYIQWNGTNAYLYSSNSIEAECTSFKISKANAAQTLIIENSSTTLIADDFLGLIYFNGGDPSGSNTGAAIAAVADGAWATSDYHSRLEFWTVDDGDSSLSLKMTMDEDHSYFETEIRQNDTSWDDLRVDTIRVTGANQPTWTLFQPTGGENLYAWVFDNTGTNEAWFAVQLPHAWKEGTDIKAHVHLVVDTTGGTGEYPVFQLEYTWANIGTVFGAGATLTADASSAANATTSGDTALTAYKHYVQELGTISGSGKTLSSMLLCRIFRDGTHAHDDYTAGAVYLLEIDFHHEIDSLGSDEEYTKG